MFKSALERFEIQLTRPHLSFGGPIQWRYTRIFNFNLSFLCLFFLGVQSCATLEPAAATSRQTKAVGKESKVLNKSLNQTNSGAAGNTSNETVNARIAMEFYLKHITSDQGLDIDDKMTLGALDEKRSSKIQLYEAAYFVGWLKQNKEKVTFNSDDDLMTKMQDFAEAVSSNALLQHPRAAVLMSQVIDRAQKQGFHFEQSSLKSKLKFWAQDISEADIALSDALKGESAAAESGSEAPSNSSEEPTGDAGLLAKADELAGNGEIHQALATLAKVRTTSPVYGEANARVQKISTTQVMTLRKKAAEEFQKALPVPDGESKKAMLMNSKHYLEEALKDYPKAAPDQIVKTKTNLDIINQKIEQTDVAMKGR